METKINDTKEFAIGTKIEYDGKLYEVVEQKFCDECSIANICRNSDKTNNIKGDLLREERIRIFGECSPDKRKDDKSVVFKEISANDNVYDVYTLYKNNKELLPIRINIPSGYVIDIDNSDLANNIIKFKRKWLTLEQMYNTAKATNYHTCLSEIKDSTGDKTCEFREKLIALANLMDIARYFNGNWNYYAAKGNKGYMIAYDTSMTEPYYTISCIDSVTKPYYGNPVFKNEADAKYVIDNPNFSAILDKIFKG